VRVGVDGSNLRDGGGINHIVQLLNEADPEQYGISQVVLWGGRDILARLPTRRWLKAVHQPLLEAALPFRAHWRSRTLGRLAALQCDLLFCPGGGYVGPFRPFVTMVRNSLPFTPVERRRYGVSWMHFRLLMLRHTQARSFAKSAGVIYLNDYARDLVRQTAAPKNGRTTVIPHGVDDRYRREPLPQQPIGEYSNARPFRILYVSKVDVYKHQWHVAAAVAQLRLAGLPVSLDLIGPAYGPALARLKETMRQVDPDGAIIRYLGPIAQTDLPAHYHAANAFVFASTCENMPNILLEAMAAGLPIACLRRRPMSEILGDAAAYFDDERPESIASALAALAGNPEMRRLCAERAYTRASAYSWTRCARETFTFLAEVAGGRPAGAL
jgi:glycosyltransferase involved in cell wall biosynthesis